jgi:F0F1-type ATP synthase assembly protein I
MTQFYDAAAQLLVALLMGLGLGIWLYQQFHVSLWVCLGLMLLFFAGGLWGVYKRAMAYQKAWLEAHPNLRKQSGRPKNHPENNPESSSDSTKEDRP